MGEQHDRKCQVYTGDRKTEKAKVEVNNNIYYWKKEGILWIWYLEIGMQMPKSKKNKNKKLKYCKFWKQWLLKGKKLRERLGIFYTNNKA